MFSDVNLLLTQPAFPFIFGSLGSFSHPMSIFGGKQVDVRIKSGSEGREVRRKGEKERERRKGRKENRSLQARMCGKVLPHSSPDTPATECALSVLVPRILLILFSLPEVASFFPLNLLIPTFPSGEHCASNAKCRPRHAE